MKLLLPVLAIAIIAGCKVVPVTDSEGNPVLNPDGTPQTETVPAWDSANEAAVAAGAILPPPWNLLLPGVMSGLTLVFGNEKNKKANPHAQ